MKNDEQLDWMEKQCYACVRTENTCASPFGVLMGEIGCWTGEGYKKVFCPYHVWSTHRFNLMKELQYRDAVMQEERDG